MQKINDKLMESIKKTNRESELSTSLKDLHALVVADTEKEFLTELNALINKFKRVQISGTIFFPQDVDPNYHNDSYHYTFSNQSLSNENRRVFFKKICEAEIEL